VPQISTYEALPLVAGSWKPFSSQVYMGPSFTCSGGFVVVSGLAMKEGGGAWSTIGTLPTGCRPSKRLVFNVNNDELTTRVDVTANGDITWIAGGNSHQWLSLSGIVFRTGGDLTLPLSNGWQAFGQVYQDPSYSCSDGLVLVSGYAKFVGTGSWSGYSRIGTLPADCRPQKQLIFNLNNQERTIRVDIAPSGTIKYVHVGTPGGNNQWLSLSGIVFKTGGYLTLPLSHGWRPFGSEYQKPSYSCPSGNGFVVLNGLATRVSGAWNNIGRLPLGCRPSKQLIFNMNNNAKTVRIDVQASGVISWYAGGKDGNWVSLNGIAFSKAQAGMEETASSATASLA